MQLIRLCITDEWSRGPLVLEQCWCRCKRVTQKRNRGRTRFGGAAKVAWRTNRRTAGGRVIDGQGGQWFGGAARSRRAQGGHKADAWQTWESDSKLIGGKREPRSKLLGVNMNYIYKLGATVLCHFGLPKKLFCRGLRGGGREHEGLRKFNKDERMKSKSHEIKCQSFQRRRIWALVCFEI